MTGQPDPTRAQLQHAAEAALKRLGIVLAAVVACLLAHYFTGDWWWFVPAAFFGLATIGAAAQFRGLLIREQAAKRTENPE